MVVTAFWRRISLLEIGVDYDRTKLSTANLLKAKATLKYNGTVPTYMVIVDLPVPPGFTVDPGDFAEMVAAKKVQKFSVTSRQVTLYIGDVKPGDALVYEYALKPKYPVKAKTPATVAYEYYTPANRGTAQPVELLIFKDRIGQRLHEESVRSEAVRLQMSLQQAEEKRGR